MSDKTQIIIDGKADGAKRAFNEVTSGAQTMALGLEQASAKGSAGFEKWMNVAQKAGAAFGAFSLLALKTSGEAEASQQRLAGAFEASGIAIDDWTAQIERAQQAGLALAFDDEDVSDSLAKLVGVTKDAAKGFADLGLAQDIARGANISLAAATDIVVATETGRFRSLAAIGIKLDETATKEDYLAAAQARYSGASERFASTGAADFQRWQNTAENALEAVGAQLGDIQGPLLALSASSTLIGSVGGALKETGIGAKIASAAMGPAGLAGAALVAGAGLYLLSQRASESEKAMEAASHVATTLNDAIYQFAAGGNQPYASALQAINDQWAALAVQGAETSKKLREADDQLFALDEKLSLLEDVPANAAARAELEAQIAALEDYMDVLTRLKLSDDSINAITTDLLNLFQKPSLDARKAGEDIAWYFQQFEDGIITQEQLVAWIDESATDWTRYSLAVVQAADAQATLNKQLEIASSAMNVQASDLEKLYTPKQILAAGEYHNTMQSVAKAMAGNTEETVAAVIPTQDLTAAMDRFVGVGANANAFLSVQSERVRAVTDLINDYAAALGQVPALSDSAAAQIAGRASAAGSAVGDAFRVAVGNTNSIGSQASGVDKWARELINVKGQYGQIDDLLRRHIITVDQYNAAQNAGTSIFAANARIQDDILDIQTNQAPVIADLMQEQARYMDELATLPADQQAIALAYMDSATSAKALTLAQLAAAASSGELGKAGEATATKMIAAAAEADPYLRGLLEDMGLITVGADGTITVNFDSVTDAGASLDDLLAAIEDLTAMLAYAFNIDIESNTSEEEAKLRSVVGLLNALNDKHTTYYVNEVRTGVTVGNPSGPGILPLDYANGGVAGYANGGIMAELAEAGPEYVSFANGGGAWANKRGLYNLSRGDYVHTAPASKSMGGNGGMTLINPVFHIFANEPQQLWDGIRENAIGASR